MFLLLIGICIGCSNKKFRKNQIAIKEQGGINCSNYLKNLFPTLNKLIRKNESLVLLKHSNFLSIQIDESQIHKKHRVPEKFSHIYELSKNDWLKYEFHLLSNTKCECITDLDHFKINDEKLSLYEDLIQDDIKLEFIEEIGQSKFNGNFRLIIFGNEDGPENVSISENGISIPKTALDLKFNKYGFLITSTDVKDEPLVFFNNAILIDLNNRKILREVKTDWLEGFSKETKK